MLIADHMTIRRIGISMRVFRTNYGEKYDMLAQNWSYFLCSVLPGSLWIPLPNIQEQILAFVEGFCLDALILTGGDDWGTFPERDKTEQILLNWAKQRHLPVLGVCRGAQILNKLSGGKLSLLSKGSHTGVRHLIRLANETLQVNSYHNYGISFGDLGAVLKPLAYCEDGSIEAFSHQDLPWLGLLWHPEREVIPTKHDIALIRTLFYTQ